MIMTIAAPVIVFAVIILVHEGGHYVTAKLTGMRVEEFAVGFGPVLYSRTIGETKYSLRMIPLGGFNKIAGMDPGDPGTDPRSFSSKPAWARLWSFLRIPDEYHTGLFDFLGSFSYRRYTVISQSACGRIGS